MLFKDLRHSIKPVITRRLPEHQQRQEPETELAHNHRLMNDATVANKPSRLQVFELRSRRFDSLWRRLGQAG